MKIVTHSAYLLNVLTTYSSDTGHDRFLILKYPLHINHFWGLSKSKCNANEVWFINWHLHCFSVLVVICMCCFLTLKVTMGNPRCTLWSKSKEVLNGSNTFFCMHKETHAVSQVCVQPQTNFTEQNLRELQLRKINNNKECAANMNVFAI